MKLLWFYNL